MEAARPRTRGRRLRRGTVERPLNARLVRVGFVVVAPAVLAFLFSISTTGALPRSPLEPLFDAESAATFAETLSVQFPSRVPGSTGAADAGLWFRETMSGLGLPTEEDVWSEDVAELGNVELRNVVTVVAGRSEESIVIVAHRDNAGAEQPLGENASGTAALIELGRSYAPQEVGPDPLPNHSLVLVSTDGGAFGGAGAARFVATSPFADDAIAVVVLDGLGRGRPRLAIAGDEPASPARALVRTATARVEEEVGLTPEIPSVPSQLVALGLPYALSEQGRFLADDLSAVTVTTDVPAGASVELDAGRLGQFGRAAEALVSSLDASVGGPFRTPDTIFLGERTASGWTARLTLVLCVVPFALGVVDLLARGRRRRLPYMPAVRAQGARLGFWALTGLVAWLAALAGLLPTGAPLPLPPYTSFLSDPPVLGLLLTTAVLTLAWLVVRRRLAPALRPTPDERLAGHIVALALLGGVAAGLAVGRPYALVFVLPSLYAWLWLPLEGRLTWRILAYSAGLAGPVLAFLLLGNELALSPPDTALYLVGLVSTGYVPLAAVLLGLVWAAVAGQVGALAFGRYGPYVPPKPTRAAGAGRRSARVG